MWRYTLDEQSLRAEMEPGGMTMSVRPRHEAQKYMHTQVLSVKVKAS